MLYSKSIEHNNSYELVKNFQRLISELGPDSQLIIRDLNSYQRRQLHIEADALCLYHWSVKVDNKSSLLLFSNKLSDKVFHDHASLKRKKKEKSLEEHIENINNQLDSLKLSKSKQISLNIKKDSLSRDFIIS